MVCDMRSTQRFNCWVSRGDVFISIWFVEIRGANLSIFLRNIRIWFRRDRRYAFFHPTRADNVKRKDLWCRWWWPLGGSCHAGAALGIKNRGGWHGTKQRVLKAYAWLSNRTMGELIDGQMGWIYSLLESENNRKWKWQRGTPPGLRTAKSQKSCGPSTPWLLDIPGVYTPFSHSGWTYGAKKLRSLHLLAQRHRRSLDSGGGLYTWGHLDGGIRNQGIIFGLMQLHSCPKECIEYFCQNIFIIWSHGKTFKANFFYFKIYKCIWKK